MTGKTPGGPARGKKLTQLDKERTGARFRDTRGNSRGEGGGGEGGGGIKNQMLRRRAPSEQKKNLLFMGQGCAQIENAALLGEGSSASGYKKKRKRRWAVRGENTKVSKDTFGQPRPLKTGSAFGREEK